jgi:hypothetical protein
MQYTEFASWDHRLMAPEEDAEALVLILEIAR